MPNCKITANTTTTMTTTLTIATTTATATAILLPKNFYPATTAIAVITIGAAATTTALLV